MRRACCNCTEYAFYIPSQLQWRRISYAESKTECQPTKHCKLYSSEIPDCSRDRKAHGPCPQAQPLRTSRLDDGPGCLPSRTGASEVCDLQWHQVELDQARMHVRRA